MNDQFVHQWFSCQYCSTPINTPICGQCGGPQLAIVDLPIVPKFQAQQPGSNPPSLRWITRDESVELTCLPNHEKIYDLPRIGWLKQIVLISDAPAGQLHYRIVVNGNITILDLRNYDPCLYFVQNILLQNEQTRVDLHMINQAQQTCSAICHLKLWVPISEGWQKDL